LKYAKNKNLVKIKIILNIEIQANRGPFFTFSPPGGRRAALSPVSYASGPKPNKFCSIKTARIFNKHLTRNAFCPAKAGQSHQHAFCENVKNIALETHSVMPPKVSTSQCCILSEKRITAASDLTLTKFTFDGKNCQSR